MCEGHDHEWDDGGHFAAAAAVPTAGPSRRRLLQAGALGLGGLAVSGLMPGRSLTAPAAGGSTAGLDGATAFRTAQHIHARGSEGPASMTAQAREAAQWVDAMWFTDHDWREAGIGAPDEVHFNSLTAERLGPNPPWRWTSRRSGALAGESRGGIQTDRVSPADPDPRGALWARAVGSGAGPASLVWYADDTALRTSMRTPAHGQVWRLEVLLDETGDAGYGLVRVAMSYHPASGGRPPAYYFLEYRFGPFPQRAYRVEALDAGSVTGAGGGDAGPIVLRPGEAALAGVVEVPQAPGQWTTRTLSFTEDFEAVFPDLIAEDNSVRGLWLGATSVDRAPARAVFDYLRMTRVQGQAQLDSRRTITAALAARHPGLALYDGSEVSYSGKHRQWLGGDVRLSSYGGTRRATGAPTPRPHQLVQMIRAGGGLAVANHPFGTNGRKLSDPAAAAYADSFLDAVARTGTGGGLQAIEIFYRARGGASLEQHWGLFRAAVRRGIVLTATGVSDNHWGRVGSWEDEANRFVTGLFADRVDEAALLDAQVRGRAYCAEIGRYAGQLDLALDEDVMGQIGVRPGRVSRDLTVLATDLPPASTVEVWKVPVDGQADSGSAGGVVATIPASSVRGGTATVRVDTDTDCAFAVTVVANDRRIAGSNPVWHLRAEPTWTVPDERRAVPL